MMRRVLSALPVAACLLFACEPNPPVVAGEGSACELSYECPAGFICQAGKCTEVVVPAHDAGAGGGSAATGGGTGGSAGTGGNAGTGGGVSTDGGSGGGAADGGTDGGMRLTFAPGSYRRCHDDLECAVFGGNCLVDLALSRPDDGGVDHVKISDIDPTFATDEGVCTLSCTADPRICDSIVVDGPNGQTASFSCQVVYAGSSPYPSPAPAFPFDATLDTTGMSRGVPFASVCRPPFQASITHAETFCQACTQDMQCGAGACFMERAAAMTPSGSCVEPCTQQSDCAFGFHCGALPGSASPNTYCLPTAGTCGRCRDGDGDLRGVGRCGPLDEPNTAVDCDDANATAYYDAANPGHAFPGVCGPSDVNCNGRSDDVEQLGGEDHCAACGDTCVPRAGELAHSRRQCVARTTTASFACVAACEPGWADCDGDVTTGCETQLGTNEIWAEDADGDGRGNPANFQYVCAGASPPAGWVQNRLDCNDQDPVIYGGDATNAAGPELCDGKDNNCNGVADDVGFISHEGESCTTTYPGVCSAGVKRCQNAATATAALNCVPNKDPAMQAAVPEQCNGLDDNCNGQTDEDLDYLEAQGQQNPNGHGAPVSCSVSSAVGICAQGTYACTTQSNTLIDGGTRITGVWACDGNDPQSTDPIDELGVDSNCDGTDGDLSAAVFVRPVAGGGTLDGNDANDGSAQHPVATINRALTLACTTTPCRDIYLEAQTFSSSSSVVIPSKTGSFPVRIYGGFAVTLSCNPGCSLTWKRGTDRSIIERTAPASNGSSYPFGDSYAAIEGATTGEMSLLLDQVDLSTEAPDPSSFLQNGQSAPSQIGIRCPVAGCRELSVRNVQVRVAAGMAGGAGTPAAVSPTTANGPEGCDTNSNCSGVSVSDWMQYPDESYWYSDALWGPAPTATCPDGYRPRGGSSGAIRWQPSGGGNRQYRFTGQYGEWGYGAAGSGGSCVSVRGQSSPSSNGTFRYLPGRGGDGIGGTGAAWNGWSFGVTTSGGYPLPNHPSLQRTATYGRTGGGGGGGGGCIYHPDYFDCPCGERRGSGGGGGGCGGYQGSNGGHGGSAIGLLLTANTTTDFLLSMSGNFSVQIGNGGSGGKGSKGGDGMGGGWGGTPYGVVDELNGGNGGNGGGGGGGAGGSGGSSIGVLRWCQRSGGNASNGCGMTLPPAMLAAPANYLTVGSPGSKGQGEAGGAAGAKFGGTRTESPSTNGGSSGGNGYDGLAGTLVFK